MNELKTALRLIALGAALAGCDLSVQAGAIDSGPSTGGGAGGGMGGGSEPVDAGCQPVTCDNVTCGDFTDLCGQVTTCGCDGASTCGGAGVTGQCGVPLCHNNKKDPGEADIDCGGSCGTCASGKHCTRQSDCAASDTCSETYCLPGVWHQKSPMPTARLSPAAVLAANGRIWVLGGFDNVDGATNVVEVYNPQDDSWASAPAMHQPRYSHSAAIGQDGRLYVFGGQWNDQTFTAGISKTAEVYDFTTQQWADLPDLPAGRSGSSCAVLSDGRLMVIGGLDAESDLVSSTPFIYSPTLSSWATATTPMLTGRADHASVQLADGRVFVAGGSPQAGGRTAAAELFDPTVPGWSSVPVMPFANSDAAAAAGPQGLIYLFGGNNGGGDFALTVVYDSVHRTWGSAASMPTARRGAAAVRTSDGRIWVFGGASAPNFTESSTDATEVLTP